MLFKAIEASQGELFAVGELCQGPRSTLERLMPIRG